MTDWWPFIGAALVSVSSVLSVEALNDFSFSDAEELLRKRNRLKQDLPRVERFAEHLRDHLETFRLLDWTAKAVALISLWELTSSLEHLSGRILVCVLGFVVLQLINDVLVRPIAGAKAERLTLMLMRPWSLVYGLLWLPTLPFRLGRAGMHRVFRGAEKERAEEQAEEEIMAAVSQSEYAGQINEEERDMIESVLGLGAITVDKVMTPRTDMRALPVDDGLVGALDMAKETGHSRLPVYEENRDNIVGICYVKDLIGLSTDDADRREFRHRLRPPVFAPASKHVSELLGEFRRERVHMAIVLDEYGGTAGLITIEDIIEEVFGEIEDEYDEGTEAEARNLDDSTLDLDAKLHVDEVNERFDVNLPESDRYESLGGLLTCELGCIPQDGQTWQAGNLRLTVLESTQRRVVRVRLEELDQESLAS